MVTCHLLIAFANSLDPDQDHQNFSPDLDPNCLLRFSVASHPTCTTTITTTTTTTTTTGYLSLWPLWGAQWLSGRVLDWRPRGRGFEPHRRHCVVVLKQDTFILA